MKISVIAIFYNSERYVDKCIESILCQRDVDIEIIAIDDSSTDSTLEILNKYSAIYANIRIIRHAYNLGIAEARNSGLKIANGDAFFLIDGDDYLASPNALAKLAQRFSSDIDWVQGSYRKVNLDGNIKGTMAFNDASFTNPQSIYDNFNSMDFIYTHNKLINIKYAKHLFKSGVLHEDRIWIAEIFNQLKHIETIHEFTYCYFVHEGQVSGKSRMKRLYIDSSMILLKIMLKLPSCWKSTIDTFYIVDIEKPLYLWERNSKYRTDILYECKSLNTVTIDYSGFPRMTKVIHKMISADIPDWLINLLAKSYVKLMTILNRPL